jgi:hypothetical protein
VFRRVQAERDPQAATLDNKSSECHAPLVQFSLVCAWGTCPAFHPQGMHRDLCATGYVMTEVAKAAAGEPYRRWRTHL